MPRGSKDKYSAKQKRMAEQTHNTVQNECGAELMAPLLLRYSIGAHHVD